MRHRDQQELEGKLLTLSAFSKVRDAGSENELARVHFIVDHLIPEYLGRLPDGPNCCAIRELLTLQEADGQPRSLTTRYEKAAAHLFIRATDFGRRQEPRLLLECARRFIALDQEDQRAQSPRPAGPARRPRSRPSLSPEDPTVGLVRVHENLDYRLFLRYLTPLPPAGRAAGEPPPGDRSAEIGEIMILNTWIPELSILSVSDAVVDALRRGVDVRILMQDPESDVVRREAEMLPRGSFHANRVRLGVRHCLEILDAIRGAVGDQCGDRLHVRLYDSLPSISIYGVDDRAFVSVFPQADVTVESVQMEVRGRDTVMGRLVFREFEKLWQEGLDSARSA
jgi:hypothetical protein